jgi:hypothetical protein
MSWSCCRGESWGENLADGGAALATKGSAVVLCQLALERIRLEVESLAWRQRAHSTYCDTTSLPHRQRVEVTCPGVWPLRPRSG